MGWRPPSSTSLCPGQYFGVAPKSISQSSSQPSDLFSRCSLVFLFSYCPAGSTSVLDAECTCHVSGCAQSIAISSNFFFDRILFGCAPEIFISNSVWPIDFQNVPKAAIYECLQGLHGVFSHLPGFWATEKNCFHIWVKDFDFGLSADEIWMPDVV